MNEKQELALALERFAKACQNDYVNEAVNKTAVSNWMTKLKKHLRQSRRLPDLTVLLAD